MGSSSVVYVFHKGIISEELCGYLVQMNMFLKHFNRKTTFKDFSQKT